MERREAKLPNKLLVMASKKFITTTASTMRLSSVLRQRPVSTSLTMNINAYYSNTTNTITRRIVHIEQHRSSKEQENTNTDDGASTKSKSPTTTTRNRSRRSRSKRISLDDKKVPSYKEFVHRFTVLSLYRGYLKCIRDGMPHNQDDLRDQVRKEFQVNKDDKDPFTIKKNIAEGQRRFEELLEFTGQSNKYTGESWINIKDPDDPRGRVGTGWPWAK